MDQIKIGNFIKALRREKGLTQEQLAERFGVARRTVSRWETGSNMPDLDILMEMSDFYAVDLRELLDGERKGEKMNKELEETVMKVADYSNDEKLKLMQSMHWLFIAGLIAAIYDMIDRNRQICRVLIFENPKTTLLRKMIEQAKQPSLASWRSELKDVSAETLEMLYIHLSNGLLHVIVEGYGRYDRKTVAEFADKVVKGSFRAAEAVK